MSSDNRLGEPPSDNNSGLPREDWGGIPAVKTEGDKFVEANKLFRDGAREINEAEDKKYEAEMRRLSGHRVDLNLRTPKDIFRAAIAPPFDCNEVPEQIASLAWHFSQATGFDVSGTLVAAVVAAATMASDRYRLLVRIQSNWYESARLWAVLLGGPSTGKSPSIDAATRHIKAMHDADHSLWWENNKAKEKHERDPEPALYTSDTTVEALADVLIDNPRGILMLTGEFDSWIGNIDSTDKAQAARNRGQWLELYDGGSRQINRVGRGRMTVPNWSASVLAGGTPDGLRKHMRSLPQDGLIHRFIPVLMGLPNFNATGDARAAIAAWSNTLYEMRAKTGIGGQVCLSPEAQAMFDTEEKHKRYLADAIYETNPALSSHLGKHPGILARVALTFHAAIEPEADRVSVRTMWLAVLFCRKVAKHWSAMSDGILSTSAALSIARAVVLRRKLTRVLHRKLTRLSEPEYGSGLVGFLCLSVPPVVC